MLIGDARRLIVFQCRYRVKTSKNGADFVHFVMPAQAPASQNGRSRAQCNRDGKSEWFAKNISI